MELPSLPLWVCQVYPDHFKAGSTVLKRPVPYMPFFSDLGGNQANMAQSSTTNVSHTTDPRSLVTFNADRGQLNTQWLRPMQLISPPMLTAFPRLTGQLDESGMAKPPEIDLTMRGSTEPQEKFKAFMDQLDEYLLEFMVQHQSLLGKRDLTKDQVAMSQRPLFKTRISAKTQKQYPDAMVLRYKNKTGEPLLVVDKNMDVIDLDKNPEAIGFNSVVRCALKFSGAYCKAGMFGASFELMAVQVLGEAPRASQEEFTNPFSTDLDQDAWPSMNQPY